MNMPDDIRRAIIKYALYWIDSISAYAYFNGRRWHRYDDNRFVNLTDDDICTLGSCLGL